VTQIFHNGLPSRGGDRKTFKVMTSTLPKGTLGSVASLLATTPYQGNPDRNHKLWNTPRFSGVRVTRSLVLYVLSIVVCPFVLFLLAIVLCVLLRYTVSDCPFGIFKLFLIY
jgi:hypothetical protein